MERSQLRAARALLGWSQEDLSTASGVSVPTLKRIEPGNGPVKASDDVLSKIETALRGAGVVLIESDAASELGGVGVRLTDSNERSRLTFIWNQIDEARTAARRAITSNRDSNLTDTLTSALNFLEDAAIRIEDQIAYFEDFEQMKNDGTPDGSG